MTGSAITNSSTALFVPAHRPDRFERATASGAGFVILDLEDAVPAERKNDARDEVTLALTAPRLTTRFAVRINAIETGGLEDARALADAPGLAAVMVPKAEHPDDLREIDAALGGRIPLLPLLESAAGLAAAAHLASAPRVARLAFGAYDFAADVGSADPRMLDHARISLVLASRQAALHPPLDSPDAQYRDLDLVREGARNAVSLGFGGKLCIHPDQVAVVMAAFAPSADELRWARRVLAAPDDGATAVDGAMVDRPVRLRAEALLARATSAETADARGMV